MDRRTLLRAGLMGAGAVVSGALSGPVLAQAEPGAGPYGPMSTEPDANALLLPEGFTSRVVAVTGFLVGTSLYPWHIFPDGGYCFPTDDGGYVYVSNSEIPEGLGGAGAIRFRADGEIADAYSILSGTSGNCAGGHTPWGTWLSCEEADTGLVWECDPLGEKDAVSDPAMGAFAHEAVAVDPVRKQLYLTEDVGDGRFYRFTPTAYPDLTAGKLEVLVAATDNGPVTWATVPDPSAASTPTRQQVPASKSFRGGEGCFYADGKVYFTTKSDNRVWLLDVVAQRLTVLYDAARFADPPLTGVDNAHVHRSGDIYVAEDGGSMDICLITPDGEVARFCQVTGQTGSELAGPAFDPSGTRLYFSAQRGGFPPPPLPATPLPDGAPGNGFGITYEVTGPFRQVAAAPSPVAQPITPPPAPIGEPLPATGLGVPATIAAGMVAGAIALRRRDVRSNRAR